MLLNTHHKTGGVKMCDIVDRGKAAGQFAAVMNQEVRKNGLPPKTTVRIRDVNLILTPQGWALIEHGKAKDLKTIADLTTLANSLIEKGVTIPILQSAIKEALS